jgi:hypothetical protein
MSMSISFFFAVCIILGLPTSRLARAAEDEPKAKDMKTVIVPDLERVTLNGEGFSNKAARVSDYRFEWQAKTMSIQFEGVTIRGLKAGQEEPVWTAKAPEGIELATLASDDKVLYLAGFKSGERRSERRPESPLRVRRLETSTGKWLAELPLDREGKPGPKETDIIQAVTTRGKQIFVLSATTEEIQGWGGIGNLVSYRVDCFEDGVAKPQWSKSFPSAGKESRPGVVLLFAASPPAKVQPDVQPLSWVGENLLVCAGPSQDLLCLEPGTGKTAWRVERIWEFERGFIGPSVWQHFLARNGKDEFLGDKKKDKDEKPPATRSSTIVGGPVVVASDKKRGASIFVAVSKGPMRYTEYLSKCVVYELNSEGRPIGVVNVPRMIRGSEHQTQKDGLVWACQGGAFAKVAASTHGDVGLGMGPGGPDLLCRIDWYRHLSSDKPDSWLITAPSGEPLAFGNDFAYCVRTGGFISDSNSGVFQFPISMVNLKNGADQTLILRVPFKGSIPEPKTNYSRSGDKGEERWSTHGPYLMAVTRLQVEGNHLRVTLGMENWARNLDFKLDELSPRKSK